VKIRNHHGSRDETGLLRQRLEHLEEVLEAIRRGEVDGLVASDGDPRPEGLFYREGSEDPYRVLVETMNEGAVTLSTDGILVYCNTHFAQMVEVAHERLVGSSFLDLTSPDHRPEVQAVLLRCQHGSTKEEIVLRTATGRDLPVLFSYGAIRHGTSLGLNVVLTDLTERRRAEESQLSLQRQLLHTQKLESLGVLAGGVAHDFNNILTAISGHCELALLKVPVDGPAASHLQQVKTAAFRAAELTKQLLAYAGKGRFLVETVDLNEVFDEFLPLIRVSVPKNVELTFHRSPEPAWVRADRGQLHQIVMNLTLNGSDAIGVRPGRVSLACRTIPASGGPEVQLLVADNGCGMDAETLQRIYDPFFTTKFAGRGLGMAAVRGIIDTHRGRIEVRSTPGEGTEFSVSFPAAPPPVPGGASARVPEGRGQGRSALLVDDELGVRIVVRALLEQLGFRVTEAAGGAEALEIFHERPDLDFVLLDLVMPEMTGPEVLERLRQFRPEVRVLLISGHSDELVLTGAEDRTITAFLQKPFDLARLGRALDGLLA